MFSLKSWFQIIVGDIVKHKSRDGKETIARVVDIIDPAASRSGVRAPTTYKLITFQKPSPSDDVDDDLDDLIKKPELTFEALADETTLLVTIQ